MYGTVHTVVETWKPYTIGLYIIELRNDESNYILCLRNDESDYK